MTDILWVGLVVLGILSVLANAVSLAQAVRFAGQIRRAMRTAFGAYVPRATLVLPVRGVDEGFEDNVRAILSQVYPAYGLIVVADRADEPALPVVRRIAADRPTSVREVLADPDGMAGKVNALRTALAHADPGDEVVVFVDADIRPPQDWLRQLVQPLADPSVGVATAFRWYVPPRPSFWSLVRAEWNGVSANVLFDPARTYAWGGSCAIRRADAAAFRLEAVWRDVLSDDLVLTAAVRDAGKGIAFVPTALVPTFEGADRRTCVAWCLRQMAMAVLYQPQLRRYASIAFAVFNGSILLGLVGLVLAALLSPAYLVPASLFLVTLPGTVAKSALRRRALFFAAPTVADAWRVPAWRTAIASLAVPWLMAWGLVRTRRPRTVRWRGRVYDVRDPRRVRLLDSEDPGRG